MGEYKHETTGFFESQTGKNGAPNVRLAGANIGYTQVATNQVVAAGATWSESPYADLSAYSSASIAGVASASHTWTLQLDGSGDGTTYATIMVSSAGASTGKAINTRLHLPFGRISIVNSDASPRTYNVWRRAFMNV